MRNPDLTRDLDNNQGVDMTDYIFEHDYSWNKEDGFTGKNEVSNMNKRKMQVLHEGKEAVLGYFVFCL